MIKRIVLVACFGLLCHSFVSFGQDSTAVKDLTEEKELQFQQYFFKALSEKAIKNYQKAIENLEFCNELLPENTSVYFEFSKNYFLLDQLEQAKQYIQRALLQTPNDIWLLAHLVEVHKKERDYVAAIEVQKKLVVLEPKKKNDLIRLYYLNRDYDEALLLMEELEKEVGLSKNLKSLKKSLEFRKGPVAKRELEDVQSLVDGFEENASFDLLKKLLEKSSTENISIFHEYSEKGIDIFPAQPFVYLMRGRSLQIQNKLQEALTILQNGIDFVIDNPKLESEFYETIAKVFEGLGKLEKAQEYKNKAKKLKTIE